jgi:phosphoribosylglycinamide formyltransferase-1
MKKIAVLFSGKGSNFASIVEHLHRREVEVVVALTNNPQAEGIAIAEKAGIPCEIIHPKEYISREAFDAEVVHVLQGYDPELAVLAGFMRILTPIFTAQIRAINLHPSLLPRHKGLHAIEKSYADSSSTGGVTVHWVSSELDGGEIILQNEIAKEGLDFESYHQTIRKIEKDTLLQAIKIALSLT